MKLCGFEKFSMVDWDGKIVCTVFMRGCNFRCPFCHNSSLALGKAESIDESVVWDYLFKRKGLVDGVCITGGEPTLAAGLKDFCKKVKDGGYVIKLDTNGTNPALLKELIEEKLVDYVAMDIKNSPAKYAQTAGLHGIDLSNIQESIAILKSSGIDYEFRTTVIKEFHTDEDMRMIATFISGAKKYCIQKYVDREDCLEHGFSEVDKATAERWLTYFDGKVGSAKLRGF